MTQTSDALAGVLATRLVPVIVIDDAAAALPLADALVAGGLRSAEVTFRTEAAEAVVRAMSADGRLLVGAGTVVTADQVDRAVAAGARFIVSPGFSTAVVRRSRDLGVPVFPGVATATEIIAALDEGVDVLKFFPAEPLGGVGDDQGAGGAVPFGAVHPDRGDHRRPNCRSTWPCRRWRRSAGPGWSRPKLIGAGRWDEITRLTAEAVAVAAESTKE